MPEQPVHQPAVLRGLDLQSVSRRHGGEQVGCADAGLEQVQGAVELEAGAVVQLPRQAQLDELVAAVDPLVADVVDRQHAAGVCEARPLDRVEVDRREGSRPVMGVDHVRCPLQRPGQLQRAPAEHGEALDVVAEVWLPTGSVDAVAAVQPLVVEKVHRHVAPRKSGLARPRTRPRRDPSGPRGDRRRGAAEPGRRSSISGAPPGRRGPVAPGRAPGPRPCHRDPRSWRTARSRSRSSGP